ncbi:hypothetical protein [Gemmobacter serpentinus]|uniref:hypothetical protein n=1 Tax=Gemmobacter serpentinus TaxID=2652247 RepID=UPI00124DEF82|nr:hypothetical protein [Gemmobacter serpentinus]
MRALLSGLALSLVLANTPAFAEPMAESIRNQLSAQGYTQIETRYTWLGRLQVMARRSGHQREIVINPNTGEILRDYQERLPIYTNAGNGGGARTTTTTGSLSDTRNSVDKSGVDVSSPVDTGSDASGSRKSRP